MRSGATDTPLWLEAAAVWLEGRSGLLAGGKSSPAAKENDERRGGHGHRETAHGNIHPDGFVLVYGASCRRC